MIGLITLARICHTIVCLVTSFEAYIFCNIGPGKGSDITQMNKNIKRHKCNSCEEERLLAEM